MVLTLYYDLLSEPSRAVYLFLKATDVPFEPKFVSLIKCDYNDPEYVKKNPWKKIPIIDDDAFILSESVAILKYIAVKYDVPDHWYPKCDVQKTAIIDEFLNWHHVSFRQPISDYWGALLLSRIRINDRYPKTPLNEDNLIKSKEDAKMAINHLADYYIKDQDFIGGNDISVADLIAVCHLLPLGIVNEEMLYESHPKVNAYVKRVDELLKEHFEDTSGPLKEVKRRFVEGRDYI